MVWSELIGLGSSLLSGFGSAKAMKRQYDYTLSLQNHQNAFTRSMSNTAHQREVKDLRAAGLNPLLSVNGGASTPAAGSSTFDGSDPVNSALQMYMQRKQLRLQEAQQINDTRRLENETGKVGAEKGFLNQQAEQIRLNNALLKQYGPSLKAQELENLIKQGKVYDSQILLNAANAHSAKNMAEVSRLNYDWNRERDYRDYRARQDEFSANFFSKNPIRGGFINPNRFYRDYYHIPKSGYTSTLDRLYRH